MKLWKLFVLSGLLAMTAAAFSQNPQSTLAPVVSVNAKYVNGVAPGYAPTSGTGLLVNLGPGTANCSGTIDTYAGGNLSLTASTANYVYLNTAASCVPAVKTSAFTSTDIPVAVVITGGSGILQTCNDNGTSSPSGAYPCIVDDRTIFTVPGSTGGGLQCLNGDVAAGSGSCTSAILATVNGAPGTCGDSTHACQVTTNGKGLVTSQTPIAIKPVIDNGTSGNAAKYTNTNELGPDTCAYPSAGNFTCPNKVEGANLQGSSLTNTNSGVIVASYVQGTGYTTGVTIALTGGTCSTQPILYAVNAGGIFYPVLTEHGSCSVLPTVTVTGLGTGASVTLAFKNNAAALDAAGNLGTAQENSSGDLLTQFASIQKEPLFQNPVMLPSQGSSYSALMQLCNAGLMEPFIQIPNNDPVIGFTLVSICPGNGFDIAISPEGNTSGNSFGNKPPILFGTSTQNGSTQFGVQQFNSFNQAIVGENSITFNPCFTVTMGCLPEGAGINFQTENAGGTLLLGYLGGGMSYTGTGSCALSGGTLVSGSPDTCTVALSSGVIVPTIVGSGVYSVSPTMTITGYSSGMNALLSGITLIANPNKDSGSFWVDALGTFHIASARVGVTGADLATISPAGALSVASCTGCGSVTSVANLAGGALGSLPYQSAASVTAFIAGPTTGGRTFIPAWQPSGSLIAPISLDLATYLSTPAAGVAPLPVSANFVFVGDSITCRDSNTAACITSPFTIPANGYSATTTGTASSGSTALTIASGTGTANGQAVFAPGYIPYGTTVASGGGTTSIVLSAQTTAAMSTTAVSFGLMDYPSQAMRLPSFAGHGTGTNLGVAGWKIADIQGDYTGNVHPLSPAVTGKPGFLFVLIGTNDEYTPSNVAFIKAGLIGYYQTARADGWKIVAYTIPPNSATPGLNTVRLQVNQWLRAQSGLWDRLIDMDQQLSDPYNPMLYGSDNIHPTVGGDGLLARLDNQSLVTQENPALGEPFVAPGTGYANYRGNFSALHSLTTGYQNAGGGDGALGLATTTYDSSAWGNMCLGALIDGNSNACNGSNALGSLVHGIANVGNGQYAGFSLLNANYNLCDGQGSCIGLVNAVQSTCAGSNCGFAGDYSNTNQIGWGINPTQYTWAQGNGINEWDFGDFLGNLIVHSLSEANSTVATATTIAPTTGMVTLTGTTPIATITVPTVAGVTTWLGCIDFIPGSSVVTTAAGNIDAVYNLTAGVMARACYNGTKWYFTNSGTVTSIATTGPISGGPISGSGTISCPTCVVASSPGAGVAHFGGATQTVTSSAVALATDVSGILPIVNGGTGLGTTLSGLVRGGSTAMTAAEISGDCTTSGSNAITCTKSSGTAFASGAFAAAYSLPTQYTKWGCETGVGDGLNAIPAGTYLQSFCYNTTGVSVTLTGLKCYIDGGSTSTMNAAGNTLGALLTGAVTCTTSFAAGTQSANVTLTSGDYIKFTFVADGTAKQTTWVVQGTY